MLAIVLSIHVLICVFLIVFILLQKSEGGGLGIGQSNSGGLGDFLSTRSTSNILTKTTSFLAVCFFLTSFSLVLIANKNYNKESIIDSDDDSENRLKAVFEKYAAVLVRPDKYTYGGVDDISSLSDMIESLESEFSLNL